MRILSRWAALVGLVSPLAVLAVTPATPAIMDRIYAEYWDEYSAINPIEATFNGDNRFNDRFGATTSVQSKAEERALAEKYLARTAEYDPASLPSEDRISYDLLRYQLQQSLDGLAFPSELLPINPTSSLPLIFAQLGSGKLAQPFATVQDYDNWLGRAAGFAPAVDGMIADMRTGMAKKIVLPKALATPILPQLESLGTTDLEKNVYMGPVRKFPEGFSEADKARLTAAYTALVQQQLAPAYQRLLAFIRDEYLPACRDTVGLSDLPGGKAWYAYRVRTMTTTRLTPDEIHEIGLGEVARIRGLMEEAKVKVGFKGSLSEFMTFLNTDASVRFTTREEIQAAYEGLRPRVMAKVPQFFGRVPKAPFEIRAVESFREVNAPPAQYFQGLPDGSRPGIFYYNAYKPETRTRFTTVAFFLHEAVPGHHFEISLAQELASLPAFRRFGGTGAYSEGWGLYSEMLGKEMGMYDDDWQWIGRLSAEIWRAVRLVIDTGVHARGWTREQSIRYFLDNVPQGEVVATQEVERYIGWPGQALCYKIGELKLRELRARAEKTLGPKFDLRAFHDEVLAHGSVPLDVLEAAVDRWIGAQR
jgi:uncharacterized protein (DUF885 family)